MMTKEQIIEQINKSFSEYKGTNEAIDDAAFYIEAAIRKIASAAFDADEKYGETPKGLGGRMLFQYDTKQQYLDKVL